MAFLASLSISVISSLVNFLEWINCTLNRSNGSESFTQWRSFSSPCYFQQNSADLPKDEREAWINNLGEKMMAFEPPKDDLDVQRSVVVCKAGHVWTPQKIG